MAYWLYCTACQQWSKSATPLSDDKTCSFCNNYFISPKQTVDSVSDSLIVAEPEGSQDNSAIPEIPVTQAVDATEGAEAPVMNEMSADPEMLARAAGDADEAPESSATIEEPGEAESPVINWDTNEAGSSVPDEDTNESDSPATDEEAEELDADENDGDLEISEGFELPGISEADEPDRDSAQEVPETPEARFAPASKLINRTKRRTRKTH